MLPDSAPPDRDPGEEAQPDSDAAALELLLGDEIQIIETHPEDGLPIILPNAPDGSSGSSAEEFQGSGTSAKSEPLPTVWFADRPMARDQAIERGRFFSPQADVLKIIATAAKAISTPLMCLRVILCVHIIPALIYGLLWAIEPAFFFPKQVHESVHEYLIIVMIALFGATALQWILTLCAMSSLRKYHRGLWPSCCLLAAFTPTVWIAGMILLSAWNPVLLVCLLMLLLATAIILGVVGYQVMKGYNRASVIACSLLSQNLGVRDQDILHSRWTTMVRVPRMAMIGGGVLMVGLVVATMIHLSAERNHPQQPQNPWARQQQDPRVRQQQEAVAAGQLLAIVAMFAWSFASILTGLLLNFHPSAPVRILCQLFTSLPIGSFCWLLVFPFLVFASPLVFSTEFQDE